MAAALKLVPDAKTSTTTPRERGFSLRDAFSRGLDQDLERPAKEARRPAEGRPMVFRVTYEAVFSLESDGYSCGNAAKTTTCLAMDAVEAIKKVRRDIERDCAEGHAKREKFLRALSRRGKKPSGEEKTHYDAERLVHFRPFHVEIVGEIDHL